MFTGLTGLVMLLSLLTGTIIYRRRFWDALRFKAGLNFKNRRTAVSTLHRITGVWALLFNAVLFFTGFFLNKQEFTPSGRKLNKPHENYEVPANIDIIIAQAGSSVNGFEPIAVNIPASAGQDIAIRGHTPQTTFFLLQENQVL